MAVGLADAAHRPPTWSCSARSATTWNCRRIAETSYYASLQKHYQPVRMLGWLVVVLVAGAGVFAGLNTMYGAVVGRVRELATLQAVGFRRRAIAISLIQEATVAVDGGIAGGGGRSRSVCRERNGGAIHDGSVCPAGG